MRILLVSSWYPPIRSGSSFWAEALAKSLRKRGHDVRVLTTEFGEAKTAEPQRCDEVVYRVPARVLPQNRLVLGLSIVPISYSRRNRQAVLDIMDEFQPEVIHQINHIFDTLFLSAYAAKHRNVPLVGSITTPIQSKNPLIHAAMRFVDRALLYRFGVGRWDRIICSDSEQARYALETYGPKIQPRLATHIHQGVHQRIDEAPRAPKSTFPHIVTVGHVHKIRDPSNLIRAMPAVLQRFPNARLDIAGRVQFQEPVQLAKRLRLENAVRFLGELSYEHVAELMSSAHAFAILHQCRYAGLSFTAIEAMHLGVPVVINAPPDLYGPGSVRSGRQMLLVDGDDVGDISDKLIEVLSDPERARLLGQRGREFVAATLSWDTCAERTEALYREMLREQLLRTASAASRALRHVIASDRMPAPPLP